MARHTGRRSWGLLRIAGKAVLKLVGKCGKPPDGGTTGIHDIVWAIYSDRKRVILAVFLHMLAWMPGAFQIWIALRFMGHGVTFTEAFIIESLSQVACASAFIMPAALGAQEAAYMATGMLFGLPPATGLALSLVQRLKDVTFGIPGLLLWQVFEGSQLWKLITKSRARS